MSWKDAPVLKPPAQATDGEPGYARAFQRGQAESWKAAPVVDQQAPASPPVAAPAQAPTGRSWMDWLTAAPSGQQAQHSLGVGVGDVVKGAGDALGLFANPLNATLNATGLPQWLTGRSLSTDVGGALRSSTGLPEPVGTAERLQSDIQSGAAGGLLTAGAANGVNLVAKAPSVVTSFAQFLADAPVLNTVAGGVGGGAAGATREAGGGPMMQLLAGLAGNVVGGGVAHGLTPKARAAVPGAVIDEMLVPGSLDGTIGETGMTPDQVTRILQESGAAPEQFSTPELAASAAQRVERARGAPAPNLSTGMPAGLGSKSIAKRLDAVSPVDRVVPPDVSIISAPEGPVRSDDVGALAGIDRTRAANSSVIEQAQARAASDPVVATILASDVPAQVKIKSVWDRIQQGGGELPALPEVPTAPWVAPTPDAAAAGIRRAANPRQSQIHDITAATESAGKRYGRDGQLTTSPKGARGEMQVMPGTQRDPGYGVRAAQNNSPDELARVGRDYIDALGRHYDGDMERAWAAYNAGPGATDGAIAKYGANWLEHMPAETRAYVNKNMAALGDRPAPQPYRAGDYSASRGEVYGFDAIDAGRPLRGNTTDNMGVAEVPESFAARQAREAGSGEMATGTSTRPFRAGGEDTAPFEARADALQKEAFAKSQADLEAEWARRAEARQERQNQRGADERFQNERVRTEQASAGDPSGIYGGKYDQRPNQSGEFWNTTPEGFIAGKNNQAVAFRSPKEAAKWAAANKMGGDFELQNWGGAKNNTRVVLRRRDGSTYGQSAPASTEPAAGRSADTSQRALNGPAPRAEGPTPSPALAPQRPEPVPAQSIPAGRKEQVVTARGRRVDTRFAVREASDLIDSSSPAYDASLQPRDRAARQSSEVQVAKIAGNLDPEQLHSSRLASQGAPIVGGDRMVESGNGRVAAIRRAYSEHPERAAEYRAMIERQGFDTKGMREPVLVRERDTALSTEERQAWTREANERDTMAMSATETAKADAAALSSETLGLFRGGGVASANNSEFARAFMREVAGEADQNALRTSDGRLSREGERRIESAMLAKAFDDAGLIQKIIEDQDTNIKAIGSALLDVAPDVARLRADIENGHVPRTLAIHDDVGAMAKIIADARDAKMKIADVLAQQDAFDPIPATVDALIRSAYNGTLTRARAGSKLADVIRFYVDEARKVDGGPSLFGEEMVPPKKEDLLDASRRRQADGPDLFQGGTAAARDQAGGGNGAGRSEPADGGGSTGTARNEVAPSDVDLLRSTLAEQGAQNPDHVAQLVERGLLEIGDGAARARLTPAGRQALGIRPSRPVDPSEAGFITPDMLLAPFRAVGKLLFDPEFRNVDAAKAVSAIARGIRDPKATMRATGEGLRAFGEATVYSTDSAFRSLADRFNAPTLSKLADVFHAEAGVTSRATERTFGEAVTGNTARFSSALDEALSAHLNNPAAMGRIRDLLATPGQSVRATAAERASAGKIRDLLKDVLEYRRDAGEAIGEVNDGYFPRQMRQDKVFADPGAFLKSAEKAYRDIGNTDPAAAAAAYLQRNMDGHLGIADGVGAGAPGSSTAKAREFGKAADAHLRDFYDTNPLTALTSYIAGAVKRAEETRRFGAKGREGSPERVAWEGAHGDRSQWDVMREAIQEEFRANGVRSPNVLERIEALRNNSLGKARMGSPKVGAAVSVVHAWNQLSTLGRAVVASLPEISMGFVRAGPRLGFTHMATTFTEIARNIRRLPPSDAARYAEAAGAIGSDNALHLLRARADDVTANAATSKVLHQFYRKNGLEAWTRAGRTAAVKTAQRFIDVLAHDITSTDARTSNRAAGYLRELGVKDPKTFAATIRNATPSVSDLRGDTGHAAEYSTALLRFANQSILMPTRSVKPSWASHPIGSLVFALQSYNYAFKKNVLDRVGRQTVAAFKERDPQKLSAAAGLLVLTGTTALVQGMRHAIYGAPVNSEDQTPLHYALETMDRTGLFGAASPLFNAFQGLKYQRSVGQSLQGSVLGRASDGLDAIGGLAINNNDNTNAAERKAAAAFYDLTVKPAEAAIGASVLRGPLGSAVILGTGVRSDGGILPSDREAFVSGVAGAKPEKGD